MTTPSERAVAAKATHYVAGASGTSKPALPKWKAEEKLASKGHASSRETDEKAMRYIEILQKGVKGVPGILASHDADGEPLIPYLHQRQAVKKAADAKRSFMLLAHDAGCGKTATFFQLFAAVELLVGGGACCIVTVPSGCLDQWEDTAHTWLKIPNKKDVIVATNQQKKITPWMLSNVRVLIISKDTLAHLYKTCFEEVGEHHKNDRGQWCKGWQRKEGVDLHPLFVKSWDVMGVDEAHFMRNPKTTWCVSHQQLARGVNMGGGKWVGGCKKRIALTATPVFHDCSNMVGLNMCIDSSPELQRMDFWSRDKHGKTISAEAVERFKEHTDRVKDDILDLPPITRQVIDFTPGMSEEEAMQYNDFVDKAKRLRVRMEQNRISQTEMQKLMLLLQRMQQMLVSPLLAEKGAELFNKEPELIAEAAKHSTGSLRTLHARILDLQSRGHMRIMVACNHVTLMRVARAYLERMGREDPAAGVGTLLFYDGSLAINQRAAERKKFLDTERVVMFLSIGAGGTGLHLVPTKRDTLMEGFCRAAIFWGSRPFSPQQVWQTLKRIHRIGQKHEVFIEELISKGSVDYAINQVHKDKSALAEAIVDNNWENCDKDSGQYKRQGRIVDNCCQMQFDGSFPDPSSLPPPSLQTTKASVKVSAATARVAPPLSSQFFRAPLAAAAASIPVKRERDDAGPSQPPPKMHRTIPLPRLDPLPFGVATMNTSAALGSSALAAQAAKLGGGVDVEM